MALENGGSGSARSSVHKDAMSAFYRVILIGTGACTVLMILAGLMYVKVKEVVSDEMWIGYTGVIFATAVSLAGAIVAIELASRALDSAKQQNILAERQLIESTLAVEGAVHYQQFKSSLITASGMLRRLQRDRARDEGETVAVVAETVRIVGAAIEVFLSSSVPATAVGLAGAIHARRDEGLFGPETAIAPQQRYFEFALSSLQYDLSVARAAVVREPATATFAEIFMQMVRLLHGMSSLVRELDKLFVCAGEIGKPKYDQYLTLMQASLVTEILPVARSVSEAQFTKDFDNFTKVIFAGRVDAVTAARKVDEMTLRDGGGILVALHDLGSMEGLLAIQSMLQKDGLSGKVVRVDHRSWADSAIALAQDTVPIFLVAEDFSDSLIQLHHFLANQVAEKWPRCIVVLDQIEQPAGEPNSRRYMSFSEHLAVWRMFDTVRAILHRARALPGEIPDLGEMFQVARFSLRGSVDPSVWNGILETKRDDVLSMVAHAAALQGDTSGATRQSAHDVLTICALLIAALLDASIEQSTARNLFPSLDNEDPAYLAFSQLVDLLAQPPLLERPLFQLPNTAGGFFQAGDRIDLFLPNTTVYGVAYLDSAFNVPQSPLVALLSERPAYRMF